MQKKYPFIKINKLNCTDEEKKTKKDTELENITFKPYNICFFDKETEDGKTNVVSWELKFDKKKIVNHFSGVEKCDFYAEVYDSANKCEMILRRLDSFKKLKHYSKSLPEASNKAFKGECGCKNQPCTCNSKFPHPKIPLKEFEEDLDFFDNTDENNDDSLDNFKFQKNKDRIIKSLRTYAFKFNNKSAKKAEIKMTATNENLTEVESIISNLSKKAKKNKINPCLIINGDKEREVIYDVCAAEIIKVWLNDEEKKEKFSSLSVRYNSKSFEFNSAWTTVVIGIIELLSLIASQNHHEDNMLFDNIWFSFFKNTFNETKAIIAQKSKDIALKAFDASSQTQEVTKVVNDYYMKMIEISPILPKIKAKETADIIDKKNDITLQQILKKFKKPEIKLSRNFPITLVVKGISQFVKNYKIDGGKKSPKFKIATKVLVFCESDETIEKKKFKEFKDKAEKFCKAEVYSYVLFTALEYEMMTLKEFNAKEFEQAIVVIVDVCYFESEVLMPYLHPRLLLILESKSSKQSKGDKKKKDESSDEESEDADNKKNKKAKGKKNQKDDSDSDGDSSDDGAKKKKAKKGSSDSDSDNNVKGKKAKGKKGKKESESEDEDEDESSEEEKGKKRKGNAKVKAGKKKNESSDEDSDESEDEKSAKKNKAKDKAKNKKKNQKSSEDEDSDSDAKKKNKKK